MMEVRTENLKTEIYKIDAVCCPPFCDGGSVDPAVHRSVTPNTVTASSCPGTNPAPATPTKTTCPTSTASKSSSCAGCSATRTSYARPSSTSSRRDLGRHQGGVSARVRGHGEREGADAVAEQRALPPRESTQSILPYPPAFPTARRRLAWSRGRTSEPRPRSRASSRLSTLACCCS